MFQENAGHTSGKDNHNSPMHEPNANDACHSNSPKHSTHNNPETKTKDPKHVFNNPPNGMTLSAVAMSAVKPEESDSPYAHLSADGTVQQIVGSDGQRGQYSGPAIPPTMLHGTWPYVGGAMAIHQRHVIKSTNNATSSSSEQETSSVMSFSSSACSSGPGRRLQPGQLGAKVRQAEIGSCTLQRLLVLTKVRATSRKFVREIFTATVAIFICDTILKNESEVGRATFVQSF